MGLRDWEDDLWFELEEKVKDLFSEVVVPIVICIMFS